MFPGLCQAVALILKAIAFFIIASVDRNVEFYASLSLVLLIDIAGVRPDMTSVAAATVVVPVSPLEREPSQEYSNRPLKPVGWSAASLFCQLEDTEAEFISAPDMWIEQFARPSGRTCPALVATFRPCHPPFARRDGALEAERWMPPDMKPML
ncbi:MAG: hypothetical protein FJX25_15205 [Alphaproteobacteria bacterium]|nr:hypothetical protein [Alphaproteobacteria bacterium]